MKTFVRAPRCVGFEYSGSSTMYAAPRFDPGTSSQGSQLWSSQINERELTEAYEDDQRQVEYLQVRVAVELVIDAGKERADCKD